MSDERLARVAVMVITIAVLAAFSGSLGNQLVDWDDEQLLVTNDAYQGLGWSNLRWMFTTAFGGHYQPLTWLSYAIETRLWGVNAAGFHFVNILFHLATAIAFFFVARRLLRAAIAGGDGCDPVSTDVGALCAALFFAVHPLRVESVVWATERRDVLSGCLLMLSVLFYLRAVQGNAIKCAIAVTIVPSTPPQSRGSELSAFVASLTCYVASLLSKATGMTLPVVLLLMDRYPLRRFGLPRNSSATVGARGRVVLEKSIFAAPALTVAIVAAWAQRKAGAMWGLDDHPLSLRIAQAFYGIVFYPWKTVWPVSLVPLYEQNPQASPFGPPFVTAALVVVTITGVLCFARRRWPALLAAWAVYIVLVSPMLGLAQSGPQLVADRYSYTSCMPLAVVVGGFVAILWARASASRASRFAVLLVILSCATGLILWSRSQTAIWKDSYTLWTTTLDRRPDTPIAHANLAVILNQRGEFERARDHALASLERLPGNRTGHLALARAAMELSDLETAERHLRIGIEIGETVGKRDPAVMVSLATVLTRLERYDEAESVYRAIVTLEPSVAEWHFAFAGFLASRDRFEDAKTELTEVSRIDPRRADACLRLGVVLEHLGDLVGAAATLERGLRIDPQDVNTRAELAWVLSTSPDPAIRNAPRALELARGAVADSSGQTGRAREALAAALAESGEFAAASQTMHELLSDQSAKGTDETRHRWTKELESYMTRRPWRDIRESTGPTDP